MRRISDGDRQGRAEQFDFSEAFDVPPEEARQVLRTIVRPFRRTGRTWVLEVTPYGSSVTLSDGSEVIPWIGMLIQKEPVRVIITLYFEENPDAQGLGEVLMGGILAAESIPGRVIVQDRMFEPWLAPFTEHLKIRIIHQADRLDVIRAAIQLHVAELDEREIVEVLEEENDADPDLLDEPEDLSDTTDDLSPPAGEHWILHVMPAPFKVETLQVGEIRPWIGVVLATHDPSPRIVATLPFEPDRMYVQSILLDHMLHQKTTPALLNVVDRKFRDWLEPIASEYGFEISYSEEGAELVAPVLERVMENVDREFVQEGVREIMSMIEGNLWWGVG